METEDTIEGLGALIGEIEDQHMAKYRQAQIILGELKLVRKLRHDLHVRYAAAFQRDDAAKRSAD